MDDEYRRELIESATGALTTDEQGLVNALPAELGTAFALVAAHDRIDQPASALAEALRQLRGVRSGATLTRVAVEQRLPFLLRLVGYVSGLPHGWTRDALTAIGAAAAHRTAAEGRAQLSVAERALAVGVGTVAEQLATAA